MNFESCLNKSNRLSVPYINASDLHNFSENYTRYPFTPVVIRDLTKNWPASKLWCLDYLENKLNSVEVEVSKLTKNTTDYDDDRFVKMKFCEYVRSLKHQMLNSNDDAEYYLGLESIMEGPHGAGPSTALAALQSDVNIPSIIPPEKLSSMNLWIGSKDTKSHLHFDLLHNLMCMIEGCKRILLFPASESSKLGQRKLFNFDSLSDNSLIDLSDIKNCEHQRSLKETSFFDIRLKSGETLYLPPGYWHYIVNEDELNIAVNIWWTMHPLLNLRNPFRRILLNGLIKDGVYVVNYLPKKLTKLFKAA